MNWTQTEKFKKITRIVLIILLIINIVNYYNAKYRTVKIPLPTVQVRQPVSRAMSEYVTQTGNTVASNTVDLVARVEGYLDKINFVDGTFVKQGTTLFVIEPEPYLAKLKEAEADLTAQKALHTYDLLEYARQKKCISKMQRHRIMLKNGLQKVMHRRLWLKKQKKT